MTNKYLLNIKIKNILSRIKFTFKLKKHLLKLSIIAIILLSLITVNIITNASGVHFPGLKDTITFNSAKMGYTYQTVYTSSSTNGYYNTEGYHYSYDLTLINENLVPPETLDSSYHYILLSDKQEIGYVVNDYRQFVVRYVLIKTTSVDYLFYLYQTNLPWYYSSGTGTYTDLRLASFSTGSTTLRAYDYWVSGDGETWTTKNPTVDVYPDVPLLNNASYLKNERLFMADSPYYTFDGEFANAKILWSNKDVSIRSDQSLGGYLTERILYTGDPVWPDEGTVGPPSPTDNPNPSATPIPDYFDGNNLNPDGTLPDFDTIVDGIFDFPDFPIFSNPAEYGQWLAEAIVSFFAGMVKLLEYLMDRIVVTVSFLGIFIAKIPFAFHAMFLLGLIFAILTRVIAGSKNL